VTAPARAAAGEERPGPSTAHALARRVRDHLRTHAALWLWAVIGLGAVVRLWTFAHGRSLWLDEAFLALSLIERSPLELFRPLDYAQVVPVGYLLLLQTIAAPLEYAEWALRSVSLAAGLVTPVLGYALARRCLPPTAVPMAVILLALSPNLIVLSGDAKPYASDVAISLGLTLLAVEMLRRDFAPGAVARLALAGAAAVWLSTPAPLLLGGIGLAGLVEAWRRRSWPMLRRLAVVGLAVGASLAAAYVVVLRHYLAQNQLIQDEYRGGFVPLPPRSLADILWLPTTFVGWFDDAGLGLPALAGFVWLVGAGLALRDRRLPALLLLAPFPVAVAASAAHAYPLYGRPIAFLIPGLLLLVAAGADGMRRATAASLPLVGPALVALLLFHPLVLAGHQLVSPPEREELAPVVRYLQDHRQEGDVVYVYYGAQFALRYYAPRLGVRGRDVVTGVAARTAWARYVEDLQQLRGRPRVWVLFAHVYARGGVDEERLLLHHLDTMGARRDRSQRTGASVYLYDLRHAPSGAVADGPAPPGTSLEPPELRGWRRR
jgi:hypothetical protein